MGLISFMNKRIKDLTVWDIQLIKLAAAFFVLFLFSFWPSLVEKYRWWWLGLFVIAVIRPIYKVWFKK